MIKDNNGVYGHNHRYQQLFHINNNNNNNKKSRVSKWLLYVSLVRHNDLMVRIKSDGGLQRIYISLF